PAPAFPLYAHQLATACGGHPHRSLNHAADHLSYTFLDTLPDSTVWQLGLQMTSTDTAHKQKTRPKPRFSTELVSVLGLVHDLVDPRHHAAQLLTNLLDRMRGVVTTCSCHRRIVVSTFKIGRASCRESEYKQVLPGSRQ